MFYLFNIISINCFLLKDATKDMYLGIKNNVITMITDEYNALNIDIEPNGTNGINSTLKVGQKAITARGSTGKCTISDKNLYLEKNGYENKLQKFKIIYKDSNKKEDNKNNSFLGKNEDLGLLDFINKKPEYFDNKEFLIFQHDGKCMGYANLKNESATSITVNMIDCDDDKNVIRFSKSTNSRGTLIGHEIGALKNEIQNFDKESYEKVANEILMAEKSFNKYLRNRAYESSQIIKNIVEGSHHELKKEESKSMMGEEKEASFNQIKQEAKNEIEKEKSEEGQKSEGQEKKESKDNEIRNENEIFNNKLEELQESHLKDEMEKKNRKTENESKGEKSEESKKTSKNSKDSSERFIDKLVSSASSTLRNVTIIREKVSRELIKSSKVNNITQKEFSMIQEILEIVSKSEFFAQQCASSTLEIERIKNYFSSMNIYARYEALNSMISQAIFTSKVCTEFLSRATTIAIQLASFDSSKKYLFSLIEQAAKTSFSNSEFIEEASKSLYNSEKMNMKEVQSAFESSQIANSLEYIYQMNEYKKQLEEQKKFLESKLKKQKTDFKISQSLKNSSEIFRRKMEENCMMRDMAIINEKRFIQKQNEDFIKEQMACYAYLAAQGFY